MSRLSVFNSKFTHVILFSLLAYAGNYFSLPLFFGVDFIFGSIVVMLAIVVLGVGSGIIVALVAGLYTLNLWGHPYAMIGFTFEAIVVGLLYQKYKYNIVILDYFYWIFIGVPLALYFYSQQLGLNFDTAIFIALKQTLNGVFNTLLATSLLLLLYLKSNLNLPKQKITLQSLIFNTFLLTIFTTAAIPVIYDGYSQREKKEKELYATLERESQYLQNYLQMVNTKDLQSLQFNSIIQIEDKNSTLFTNKNKYFDDNKGVITSTKINNLKIWIPSSNLPAMKLWKESLYMVEFPIQIEHQAYLLKIFHPAKELVNSLQKSKSEPFIILNILMLIGILISILLSKKLSRSVNEIAEYSKRISKDVLTHEKSNSKSYVIEEYSILQNSLQSMMKEIVKGINDLKELNNNLEQKVFDQTQELVNKQIELEDYIRSSTDFVWEVNKKGEYTKVSKGVYNILGYHPEEVIGTTPFHLMDEEEAKRIQLEFSKILENKAKIIDLENLNIAKDGSEKCLITNGVPFFDIDGEFAGYRGSDKDITQLKSQEKELKDSEFRWKFAIEGNKDGLWDWNITKDNVYFSSQWKKMLGFEEDEIENSFEAWVNLIKADKIEEIQVELNNYLEGKIDNYRMEHELLCKDGSYKWILSKGIIVQRDDEGKPLRMIGTHTDIDKQKQLEEELVKAKEEAEQASQSKSSFLANMSHEIRTPMTGLLGFVDRLQKSEENPEKVKQFQTIRNSGETLLSIINDILDFSKIESGKMEIEYSPVLLQKFFEEAPQIFQQLASSKNINLLNAVNENIPACILGDTTRLKQVIFNLMSNALKFTNEGGNVTLQAYYKKEEKLLHVAVIDTGIGIAKEHQKKIFEAFSQEDISTTRKFGGTGLGLTISSQLIKLMGGALKLESEVAKGSKFYFDIPVDECSLKVQETATSEEDEDVQLQGHVLIVEDNKTNQMLLGMILDDHGITYDVANDGAEGVLKTKQTKYDAILMDENMPIMNGIEATRIIRENEEESNSKIPIIAVTANALLQDRERFLAAGMDDYISKPYTEEDIVRVLKKYLG